LPLYVATIGWLPTLVYVTVHVAVPVSVLTGKDWQPAIGLALSVNESVPPFGTGLTVAVNVIDAATSDGFAELETVVVVGNWNV